MPLVSDLINEAFLALNAIAAGESITTAEQSDAFLRLQQMMASWSREQLTVPQDVHGTFTLTAGLNSYTLGTGGTLATASQPVRVTGASSVSGNFRSPMRVISFDQFAAEVADEISSTSVLAKVLAADRDSPSINLRVHPVPATSPGSLLLDYWIALTPFVTVGDMVSFPEGYEHALWSNLAVILYPQYGRPGGIDPVLASIAQTSKQALVALNAQILGQTQAPPAPQRGG